MSENTTILTMLLALVLAATGFFVVTLVQNAPAPAAVVEPAPTAPPPVQPPAQPVVETTSSASATSSVTVRTTVTLDGAAITVAEGDTLEALAQRAYGDADLAPAIVWASTLKAAEDPAFSINTENGEIQAGQKLWLPDHVDALQRQFQQANALHADLHEATIEQLQARMREGTLSARALVQAYLERIHALNRLGPQLNAVIEVNPDALADAEALDRERRERGPRGPLHGIPVLLKDNVDTADAMQTTAGSLALLDSKPARDATVAARLREAGAVILGKANLSEWANFRGNPSISGWSGRGGLTRNPYRLDATPWGSSSGSGVAVAANLTSVALGTETAGSIIAPSAINGIVGLKPTVGLTSRAGVVPIAHSFDTVGPMTRTVADAAAVLGAIAGVDGRDPATAAAEGRFYQDYSVFLDPDALQGARIGVPTNLVFLGEDDADKRALFDAALDVLRARGAEVVEVEVPGLDEFGAWLNAENGFLQVLEYEFKGDLNQYLSTRVPLRAGAPFVDSLAKVIAFNERNAQAELALFGHELLVESEDRGGLSEVAYLDGLTTGRRLAGVDGLDAALAEHGLDALFTPALESAARIYTALAGYPLLSVPAGFTDGGLPFGVGFFASAFSEPTLIRLGYAYEQASQARRPPQLLLRTPESTAGDDAGQTQTTNPAEPARLARVGAPGLGDSLYPTQGNGGYDVRHYTIQLVVDPERNALQGSTTIDAVTTQPLVAFNLDFLGLDVRSVQVDGRNALFVREGAELTVLPVRALEADAPFSVTVNYVGTPQPLRDPALSFTQIGWRAQPGGTFVVSQPSGAMTWFPSNNHPLDKATYTFRVTVPSAYQVAANGRLAEEFDHGATTTYLWEARDPMASYLATLHIGQYDVETSVSASGVPIRNYFPAGTPAEVRARFSATPEMIAFLEAMLGPYPFENYGVVLLNLNVGFALETQTLSTFGRQGANEVVVLHELAHQWFGNNLSLADWQDIWLNEGFATYLSFLWLEHTQGAAAFAAQMDQLYQGIVGQNMQPPGRVGQENLFDGTVYVRGAWTLHALRLAVGDAAFFVVLRAYYERFAGGHARTADFYAVVAEIAGDQGELLDAWVFGDGVPDRPEMP